MDIEKLGTELETCQNENVRQTGTLQEQRLMHDAELGKHVQP
jgi:hypothetical protein